MIGEINLLLDFKTEVQFVFAIGLYTLHHGQLHLIVLDHLLPTLLHLPSQANSVILFELLILHVGTDTLEKYYKIFMCLITRCRSISVEAVKLKWKKVLEDGFREYCAFIGSKDGVRTILSYES